MQTFMYTRTKPNRPSESEIEKNRNRITAVRTREGLVALIHCPFCWHYESKYVAQKKGSQSFTGVLNSSREYTPPRIHICHHQHRSCLLPLFVKMSTSSSTLSKKQESDIRKVLFPRERFFFGIKYILYYLSSYTKSEEYLYTLYFNFDSCAKKRRVSFTIQHGDKYNTHTRFEFRCHNRLA